jgi:hypothetical protein
MVTYNHYFVRACTAVENYTFVAYRQELNPG